MQMLSLACFSPRFEVFARLLFRCRIKPEDGTALEDFLHHKILESRHLDCLIGNFLRKMRGNDDDALTVAYDHVAWKDRSITAAGRAIDLDGLARGEIRGSGRTVMIGLKRMFAQLRGDMKAAV